MNRALLIAILLLPAVLAPSTFAWVPSTVESATLLQTKWAGSAVSFRYNPNHGSNITGSNTDVQNAVLNAFAHWQEVSNTSLTITNAGTTAATTRNSSDHVNSVLFQDPASLGGALAITFTSFNPTNGNFADADIVFDMSLQFSADILTSGRFDLESVLTHEVGHLLGLDHTDILSATMYQSTPSAADAQRTLSADDIAGLRATYPGGTATGALSGRVTKGGVGVLGAAVFVLDSRGIVSGGGLTTDSQGNFAIRGLEPGTYSVGVEPLDGPMTQGNLGGFFRVIGTFDDVFITKEPSGSFVVTAGSTTTLPTPIAVTAGTSGLNPTNVIGLATGLTIGSVVTLDAGTSGAQLALYELDGVTSTTQISIPGTQVSLGSVVTRHTSPASRGFPITFSPTTAPGGRCVVLKNGTDVAILVGGFDVTGGQVAPPNTPPTANAGTDQTDLVLGATVNLAGSATDPDVGNTLTYSWTPTLGAFGTLSGADTRTPSFTANARGTFTFTLTVSDGAGGSGSDTVNVTVVNRAPTASAGSPQTVTAGNLVTLTGSGSDLDNDSLTYSWSLASGPPVSLSNAAVFNPTFTPLLAGTYVFDLIVSDGLASSFASSVTITVNPANQAPVARAGSDQTQTGSAAVTLDGQSSSDPDGTPITYLWERLSGPVVSLTGATSALASFTPS
ncbi:MAG: M36 family peptidase, partial [bacterium]